MAYPSLEEVTRELTRRFQEVLGDYGAARFGGKRIIEVTNPATGAPEREFENKPRISITGPELKLVEMTRKPRGTRVMTGSDHDTLTYTDSPYPQFYDCYYEVLGWSIRDVSIPAVVAPPAPAKKGILWLQQVITPFLEGGRLVGPPGGLWSADQPVDDNGNAWPGYYFEHFVAPKQVPGLTADLFAIKATVRIRSVRVTDEADNSGPTIGTVIMDPTTDPAGA